MALQNQIQYMGLSLNEAYWKISGFVFTSKTECRAYLELHANHESSNNVPNTPLKVIVVDFTYDYNNTQQSLHTQAYNAAKLLPELENSIDV